MTSAKTKAACSPVPFGPPVGQHRDDVDAAVELRLQSILASRRRANASGQAAEDAGNIQAALRMMAPNAQHKGPGGSSPGPA